MAQNMKVGSTKRQELAASVLPSDEWDNYLNNSSDFAGFVQLAYHAGCAAVAAFVIHMSLEAGSARGLIAGELMLGFVSSFYFMGFHEFIHNTAFATKWINNVLASVVGFFIFRGANWFWCFHWLHHRYTQDPEKDPELSGGSSDLMDPSRSVFMYMRFLTGWPFGFERTLKMVKMARGQLVDPWVEQAGMEKQVRIESCIYVMGYISFFFGALLNENVRSFCIWYWLVPHMLGAGHLRFYQFAEHRACETGTYTDLDAWGSGRTTAAWFFYRRLAWNMPFHIEHHAWPAVPFHLLPDVHERIKDKQPKSRCLIQGDAGYFAIHMDFLRRVVKGEPTVVSAAKTTTEGDNTTDNGVAAALNRLDDADAMAKLPRFTMEDVAKHNSKSDCWVVVNGIVMDVTTFLPDHPGGETILANKAGKDASKMFKMIHPDRTLENHLPDSCIVGLLLVPEDGDLATPLLKGQENPTEKKKK